jgi:hypothetical protein
MNPYRFELSLRCWHDTKSPSEICELLGIEATARQRAGQERRTPRGKKSKGTYKSNYCSFELSAGNEAELPNELKRWNKRLLDKAKSVREFRQGSGRMEYFVGLFIDGDSGFELDPEVASGLSKLGITLNLDIYPPDVAD